MNTLNEFLEVLHWLATYKLRRLFNSITGSGYKNHLCNPIYADHYERDVANLSQRHRRQYERARKAN